MNEEDLREILQSDFKLWEAASTTLADDVTDRLVKEIDLPYDIGLFSVTFEGVKDATSRRDAVAQFAATVRNEIDNRIGEAAVTARAAQRPSRVGSIYGQLTGIDGDSTSGRSPLPDAQTVPAYGQGSFTISDDPGTRLDELREEYGVCLARATTIKREVKALEAYVAVMQEEEDASEVQREEEGEVQEQVQDSTKAPDPSNFRGERDKS